MRTRGISYNPPHGISSIALKERQEFRYNHRDKVVIYFARDMGM
jgi:hypothetical protein